MEIHPAANIFPMMSDADLSALAADIKEHGQRECCVFYEGKLLDGRNRWKACERAGVEPEYSEIESDDFDPVAFVISTNLKRRHLTESQRAMAAAAARGFYDTAAKERKSATLKRGASKPVPEKVPERDMCGDARDIVGDLFGVSGKTVDAASAVREHGSDELIAAVESGKVSVSKAAKVAKASPKEIQMEEVQANTKRKPKPKPSGGVLDKLKKLWKDATAVERAEFIEWTDTNRNK